ncbi:MAG: peptidoglycan DD-metalloendopeptidase family protein [Bacteroidota bacterium]
MVINKKRGAIVGIALLILGLGRLWKSEYSPWNQGSHSPKSEPCDTLRIAGIRLDTLVVDSARIQNGDDLGSVFEALGMPYSIVQYLVDQPDSIFNARQLRSGQRYWLARDSATGQMRFWIFEKNRIESLILDLRDTVPQLSMHRKPVITRNRQLVGVIQSSLFESVTTAGAGQELAMALAGVFDWTVDFFQIQKGDCYRVYYTEQTVDSVPYGNAQILAAEFRVGSKTHTAIRFQNSYFDALGQSMKRRYLKAPLDYSRISSGFSTSRLHPVLRYLRPHLGVDYAAPKGTPVRAVGDGQILEAGYRGGNGNFVKIKHSRDHATGYLHLSRIASGVRRGGRVRQGQVIGYVGSTGLSTGPHLCFRFWNRGVQVNPRKLQAPQAEPMKSEDLPAFKTLRDSVMASLPAWPSKL